MRKFRFSSTLKGYFRVIFPLDVKNEYSCETINIKTFSAYRFILFMQIKFIVLQKLSHKDFFLKTESLGNVTIT